MGPILYVLNTLTALMSSGLLLRGFQRNRSRLLLWSGLCFAALALNNALVFADLVIFPEVDLSLWRSAAGLAGLALLLYGLIWDAR
ncbi:MAG: hypothetical protein HY013_07070 [Candidatus Solibacter usitatus]|nr:hypothetical protein [Candidatus Solibacter usitatus]